MNTIVNTLSSYRNLIYAAAGTAATIYLLKRMWCRSGAGVPPQNVQKVDAAFFLSITGLPTHKGHVDMVEKAIIAAHCQGKNVKIWLSLAHQEDVAAKYNNPFDEKTPYDPTRMVSQKDRIQMAKNAFHGFDCELLLETPQNPYKAQLKRARTSSKAENIDFYMVQGADFTKKAGASEDTITVGRAGEELPKKGKIVPRDEADPLAEASSTEVAKGHLQYLHPANVEIFLRAKAAAFGRGDFPEKREEFVTNCEKSGCAPKGWKVRFVAP